MRRLRSPSTASTLLLLLVPACGEDFAGGGSTEGNTDGIGSLDGGSSSGSAGETAIDDSTGEAPSCDNDKQDEGEIDVDCGGTCGPCGPGSMCSVPEDCDTNICAGGFCQTPTCYDGMLNGEEEGVDCGGSCPNSCANTDCINDNQCGDGNFCHDGVCMPSSCENELIDTLESDVDCGGPSCPDCPVGGDCNGDADCDSGVCTDGTCAAATCRDGVFNGDETDEDCGGSCGVCPTGSSCTDNSDCEAGVCAFGTCVDPSCDDLVHNGSETDVDCGGTCPPCGGGAMCEGPEDCADGICDANVCIGPECDDTVQNGDESDIDCGGACGATCQPNEDCLSSLDCVEGVCEFGTCAFPDCNDDVQNATETDLDCGGSCGATCSPGQGCGDATDCVEGVCDGTTCEFPQCDDTVFNGTETDTDCGGGCGATCEPGEACAIGDDCVEGVCILAECQAPACDDGVQNGLEEGLDCAGGCPRPCPVGGELFVNTTLPDFQVQPGVVASPSGSFYAVVWASFPVAAPPQDGNGSGVFVRVYDSNGNPITGEVAVNTTTAGNQQFPAIDATDTGFVVTWQGPDVDGTGIFARRFDATGVPQGGEIAVNGTTALDQRRPDIAVEDGGQFVVCWDGMTTTSDIYCRRFGNNGVALAAEAMVNVTTGNQQQLPAVEIENAATYVVTWQSAGGQDGSSIGVYMRRFMANGTAIGASDTQVNQFTAGDQGQPSIGMAPTGAFVITWSSAGQDADSTAVVARRYNATAVAQGAEFVVNTTTEGAQNNPAVTLNSDGAFVIAWQTADDGVLTGVFAQRYQANGTEVSEEFTVNPTTLGLQEEPDVALRGSDEIVGVWSEGDVTFTNRDIRLQRYDGQLP